MKLWTKLTGLVAPIPDGGITKAGMGRCSRVVVSRNKTAIQDGTLVGRHLETALELLSVVPLLRFAVGTPAGTAPRSSSVGYQAQCVEDGFANLYSTELIKDSRDGKYTIIQAGLRIRD